MVSMSSGCGGAICDPAHDDRAERALIRTAASGIEAGCGSSRALEPLAFEQRQRRAVDGGRVVHVIVKRLEPVRGSVLQDLVETSFRFAGEDRQAIACASRSDGSSPSIIAMHARHVKGADGDFDARLAQRSRDVERARRSGFDCTPISMTMPSSADLIRRRYDPV